MPVSPRALLACLFLLLLLPAGASAQTGTLDPAFANQSRSGSGPAVAAFPVADGKTLVVAQLISDAQPAQLVRLRADGEPDPAYGTDGVVTLPASLGSVADAVRAGDGDLILLLNRAAVADSYSLARVDAGTGALDTSWGTGGIVQGDFDAFDLTRSTYNFATGVRLARHGDGVVVLVNLRTSSDASPNGPQRIGLARHELADGALDPEWGEDAGTTTVDRQSSYEPQLAAEPDAGRVWLVEQDSTPTSQTRIGITRFAEDGAPDTTFGADDGQGDPTARRQVSLGGADDVTEIPRAVLVTADGGLWLAGDTGKFMQEQPFVARITDTGALDPAFGTGGVVRVPGRTGSQVLHAFEALAVDGDGLVAAGAGMRYAREAGGGGIVARFTATGLDTSWGDAGRGYGGPFAFGAVTGLFVRDGFLTVTGATENGSSGARLAAARYDGLPNRTPVDVTAPALPSDADFISDGQPWTATTGTWRYAASVAGRWQRCTSATAGCSDIQGATGDTYTPVRESSAYWLRYVETATNGTASLTRASSTSEIEAAEVPVAFTSPVTVSPGGSVPVGTALTATWTDEGATSHLTTWLRCPASGSCTAVAQGDDPYVVTGGDVGSTLRAHVQLYGKDGPAIRDSAPVTPTAAGGAAAPVATSAPAITPAGEAAAGTTLTKAGDGTWDQTGLTFGYRWERCDGAACTPIAAAGTGTRYTTTAADAGHGVRLVVSARRGDGPVGTAASAATAITAAPQPTPDAPAGGQAQPAAQAAAPATAFTPSATVDATSRARMPDVRGLQLDEAKRRIAAAGIYADVTAREVVRRKPLKLAGKARLDVGDVSGQSLPGGTAVVSAPGVPRPLTLVTEAGPKATKGNGGAAGPVCTGKAVRQDLKGAGLDDVLELLEAKRCSRLDVDFVLDRGVRDLQIVRAAREDRELALTVKVPGAPGNLDLVPAFRQGAFNGRPSFDRATWTLGTDTVNVLGVQTLTAGGLTLDGAEVLLDGSDVGMDDIHEQARGAIWVRGVKPTKAGTVNVLVAQSDAAGNRLFGFGRFEVVDRKGAFTAIDGKRYGASGRALLQSAAAHAATPDWLRRLASALGLGGLFQDAGATEEQSLSAAAKQQAGLTQLSFGQLLSGGASVIAPGGGNVIAPGGANVIAPGGGNVIAPGGGNVIAPGGGNVIAPGGANAVSTYGAAVIAPGGGNLTSLAKGGLIAGGGGTLLGAASIQNGTGSLIKLPSASDLIARDGAGLASPVGGGLIARDGAGLIARDGGG